MYNDTLRTEDGGSSGLTCAGGGATTRTRQSRVLQPSLFSAVTLHSPPHSASALRQSEVSTAVT